MKKIFVLLIIISLLLYACQSTPEEEIVKQRSFEKLLEKNEQAEREEYSAEFSDELTSQDGKVKITFNAKVITPDVDEFPVIEINPQPVTKEIMQLVADEFMGGETGYYPENYMTKSEIEDRLLKYYAKLENEDLIRQEYEKHMPEAEIDYEAVKEGIKHNIANYTAMLENAPEEKENAPSYYNLRPLEFYITNDHNLREAELSMTQAELKKREENPEEHLYLVSDRQTADEHLRLIVYNELPVNIGDPIEFGMHGTEHYEIQFVRARNDYFKLMTPPLCSANPTNTSSEGVENFDVPYPELEISEDEAVEMAQETLNKLGIDNFYLVNLRVVPSAPTVEEYQAYFKAAQEDEELDFDDFLGGRENKFYLLTFKPEYYGVPLINANNSYSEEVVTYLPFTFEEIKVKVSNDAIVEFRWANPTDVSHVINENANLLPFAEIAENAINHMKLKYNMATIAPVWEESETYEEDLAQYLSAEINITEIRLGLGGVAAYNNPDEYMLIPVWSFYGSYAWDCKDDERDYLSEDLYIPFVSINAVDGSVVDQKIYANYD